MQLSTALEKSLHQWKELRWEEQLKVAAVVVLVPYVTYKIGKWIQERRKPHFPGPSFLGSITNPLHVTETMDEWHKKYGDTYVFSLAGQPFISTTDPELVNYIFLHRKQFPNPKTFRVAMNKRMGSSTFTTEGDTWKHKRNVINPLLSQKMLEHHANLVIEKAKTLTKNITPDQSIDIHDLVSRLAIDVIGKIAFGEDFQLVESDNPEGMNAIKAFRETLAAITFRIFVPIQWIWKLPIPVLIREERAARALEQMFEETLRAKEAEQVETDIVDLPSLLLKTGSNEEGSRFHKYTFREMLGECYSVFGAGHDTTGVTSAFIIGALSLHPQVQEKIFEEIQQISGSTKDYSPTFEDLKKMPYIDAVVEETLRLYPGASSLLREAEEDFEWKGVTLPKGQNIFLNLYSYHRREDVYSDPLAFQPERWLADPPPPEVLTFGKGIRPCFGRRLARMELSLLVFAVCQQFTIHPDPKHPFALETAFGIRPAPGGKMFVSLRAR